MIDASGMLERAEAIAEGVLLPAAMAVDRADLVPARHLDLLAAEGFYGVAAPPEVGGFGVADMVFAGSLLETLASGCLATTFVWMQHTGPVIAATFSDRPGVRERWLGPLARGERRAGIALAGLRPGPAGQAGQTGRAGMRVAAVPGGYRLDGEVPWVTGWDMIDTVQVAARDADDRIHYLLVDAVSGATLTADLMDLVAVRASRTVNLRFTGHVVPADRLLSVQPYEEWARADAGGSALNGFLALGVVRRCCRLLGPGPLDEELAACRAALHSATAQSTPQARAVASELALRASASLAARTGSRSVLVDNIAQRLVREAAFLLVFGTRPAIRDALLQRLAQPPR